MKRKSIQSPAEKDLARQLWRIYRHQLLLALLVLLAALVLGRFSPGWLLGAAAGLGDSFLILWGIYRGMQKPPEKAALYMRRMMVTRLGWLLCLTLLALKARWQPVLVMLGFVAFNVTIVIYMAMYHIKFNK